MKKAFLVFAASVIVTTASFALDISAGIGVDCGWITTKAETTIPDPARTQLKRTLDKADTARAGFWGFIDLKYLEGNLGLRFVSVSYSDTNESLEETGAFFNMGAKLKYPFAIMPVVNFFPLIGFDYSIFTGAKGKYNGQITEVKRDDLEIPDSMDRLWVNFGAGADFSAMKNLYIRAEFNYVFLLNGKNQKDLIKEIKSLGYDLSISQYGPVFKIAAGYKFGA